MILRLLRWGLTFLLTMALAYGARAASRAAGAPRSVQGLVLALVGIGFLAVFARHSWRRFDRRPLSELGLFSLRQSASLLLGVAVSLGLGLAQLAMLLALGGASLGHGMWRAEEWPSRLDTAVAAAGLCACVGYAEEVFIRGAVYRIVRERWPVASSTVISGLLFGLLHLGGGASSPVFVLDALLMSIALVLSREQSGTLAFAVGWHAGWDFFQEALGLEPGKATLLDVKLTGATWLVGTETQPGAVATLVLLLFTAATFAIARGRAFRACHEHGLEPHSS